jgi:hypothetical protein
MTWPLTVTEYVAQMITDSTKELISETDIVKMLEFFFYGQHICYVWRACFSTDSLHSYGYQLCSSSCRLVLLFAWGILHKGTSKNDKKLYSPII